MTEDEWKELDRKLHAWEDWRQRQEEAARRALDDPEIKRAVHRKPQARS